MYSKYILCCFTRLTDLEAPVLLIQINYCTYKSTVFKPTDASSGKPAEQSNEQ